jgi:protein-tyrosine phosphatase
MAPAVINLKTIDDHRDAVHRAVEALAAGKVVAAPTETVYGLAALATDGAAVERLLAAKRRPEGVPVALALKNADEAGDFVPEMPPVARRLARRCWPGPVTLVVDHGPLEASLVGRLPESVRCIVAPEGAIGLRVAAHAIIYEILQYTTGPLVLTSANRTGEPDATTAEQVIDGMKEDVDLVLDDGPCRYGQPSSVVRVHSQRIEMLREGVVGETTINRLASFMVLMVCTGNTCRSPMAEALMRSHLATRLECNIEALEEHGAIVASAGIAAGTGGRPSSETLQVLREMGISLNGHITQPVTSSLVRHADLILTMTRGHRDALVGHWPSAAGRTELLRQDQRDIPDPIGGPIDLYRSCAQQMDDELRLRAARLEI